MLTEDTKDSLAKCVARAAVSSVAYEQSARNCLIMNFSLLECPYLSPGGGWVILNGVTAIRARESEGNLQSNATQAEHEPVTLKVSDYRCWWPQEWGSRLQSLWGPVVHAVSASLNHPAQWLFLAKRLPKADIPEEKWLFLRSP